jgi:hypothetical protein
VSCACNNQLTWRAASRFRFGERFNWSCCAPADTRALTARLGCESCRLPPPITRSRWCGPVNDFLDRRCLACTAVPAHRSESLASGLAAAWRCRSGALCDARVLQRPSTAIVPVEATAPRGAGWARDRTLPAAGRACCDQLSQRTTPTPLHRYRWAPLSRHLVAQPRLTTVKASRRLSRPPLAAIPLRAASHPHAHCEAVLVVDSALAPQLPGVSSPRPPPLRCLTSTPLPPPHCLAPLPPPHCLTPQLPGTLTPLPPLRRVTVLLPPQRCCQCSCRARRRHCRRLDVSHCSCRAHRRRCLTPQLPPPLQCCRCRVPPSRPGLAAQADRPS